MLSSKKVGSINGVMSYYPIHVDGLTRMLVAAIKPIGERELTASRKVHRSKVAHSRRIAHGYRT